MIDRDENKAAEDPAPVKKRPKILGAKFREVRRKMIKPSQVENKAVVPEDTKSAE